MPARIVGLNVAALSYAACASATFEAHRLPPERNGTPSRRASAAIDVQDERRLRRPERRRARLHRDRAREAAEDDRRTRPDELDERHARRAPRRGSGRAVPATVTGDIAPARMNGVMSVAWFASA